MELHGKVLNREVCASQQNLVDKMLPSFFPRFSQLHHLDQISFCVFPLLSFSQHVTNTTCFGPALVKTLSIFSYILSICSPSWSLPFQAASSFIAHNTFLLSLLIMEGH